jgi:hypothetical protein
MTNSKYEMVTLKSYLDSLENETKATSWEDEIKNKIERHFLEQRRARTNAKIVETFVA